MPHTMKDIRLVFDSAGNAPQTMADLLTDWITHVRNELQHNLGAIEDREEIEAFQKEYARLDDIGKARFLACPYVSEFLEEPAGHAYDGEHIGAGTLFESMRAALGRELKICEIRDGQTSPSPPRDGEPREIRSPLGDVIAIFRNDTCDWSLVESRKIGGLISIDFDSEISVRHEPESGAFSQPRLPQTESEQATCIAKLERALALIDEAAPIFGLMIKTFTRRIIVRKTMQPDESDDSSTPKPVALASEFRPVHSGCLRMLNVHRDEMDIALCMEAMVHETVHSFLSCYEDIYGKFMSTHVVIRPMSPWSGNLIPNHSLAHAIFVYYAIFWLHMSSMDMRAKFTDSEYSQVERRLSDVTAGFMVDRPLSSLFLLDNPACEHFDESVDSLQAVVVGAWMDRIHASDAGRAAA
jgi:hypothetical protein